MKETREDVLNRCVLVRDLKLFTLIEHISTYFNDFGKVLKVCLVHRSNRTYTRCAIVLMQTKAFVDAILDQQHKIYDGDVTVERFNGIDRHPELLADDDDERFKFDTCRDTKLSNQAQYEKIERLIHPNYKTIEFSDDKADVATVVFKNQEDMTKAEEKLKNLSKSKSKSKKQRTRY